MEISDFFFVDSLESGRVIILWCLVYDSGLYTDGLNKTLFFMDEHRILNDFQYMRPQILSLGNEVISICPQRD